MDEHNKKNLKTKIRNGCLVCLLIAASPFILGYAAFLISNFNQPSTTQELLDEWYKTPWKETEYRRELVVKLIEQNPNEEKYREWLSELDRKNAISKQFSNSDGSHIKLAELVQKNMNDPDSFENVGTTYIVKEDHLIVTMTFRGMNAFGGKVMNTITAKVDLQGNVLEILKQ